MGALTPAWFVNFSSKLPAAESLDVAGADISYRVWACPSSFSEVPLLFVHGGSANSSWWHPVIALLQGERTIATIDLSGHGLSDWRDVYSFRQWQEELAQVATLLFPRGCVLIGHSLGGALAAAIVAQGYPAESIILLDSDPTALSGRRFPRPEEIGRPREFDTATEAAEAVVKHKTTWPTWVAHYVAQNSIEKAGSAWRMLRDPRVASTGLAPTPLEDFSNLPVHFIFGEESSFALHRRSSLQPAHLPRNVTRDVLDGLGHDLLVESPARTAATIERYLVVDQRGPA